MHRTSPRQDGITNEMISKIGHQGTLLLLHLMSLFLFFENVNLISSIIAKIQLLHSRGQQVIIIWIRIHIGIFGKEADKAVYAATSLSHITAKIPTSLRQLKATICRNSYISSRNQHMVWIQRNSPSAKWYKEVTQYWLTPIL